MDAQLANYLAELMPAAPVDCAECFGEMSISDAVVCDGKFFCCAAHAERHLAPMKMDRPKGPMVDYWDV